MNAAPLRLLVDEAVPGFVVARLRANSIDTEWIAESVPGSSDETVLAMAVRSNRVLVTLDKDFGELVFRRMRSASAGVILVRAAPVDVVELLMSALASERDWIGHFTVVESSRIRMTRITPP